MQKYNSHRERKDNAKGGVPLHGQNNGVLPEQTVRLERAAEAAVRCGRRPEACMT